MIGAFSLFLVLLCLLIIAGLQSYRRIPSELSNLASNVGMTLKRSWTRPGKSLPGSQLLFGEAFTGTYRDRDVILSSVVNDQGSILGTSITFPFQRPLALSLFSAVNIASFSAAEMKDEYRDMYLQRVDTGVEMLKTWAKDKDKAGFLLRGGDVHERLVHLSVYFHEINRSGSEGLNSLRKAGIVINDQEVILLVTSPVLLTPDTIEAAYDLAQALSGAGFGPSAKIMPHQRRGIVLLVMVLLVCFLLLILGFIIAGIFNVEFSFLTT